MGQRKQKSNGARRPDVILVRETSSQAIVDKKVEKDNSQV